MYTRPEYIDTSREPGAFERYYGEIVNASGGPEKYRRRLPPIHQLRACLDLGDVHFNMMPVSRFKVPVDDAINRAFRERLDWPTAAGITCMMKVAARMLVEAENDR